MTDTKKPRKPRPESLENLMTRIESQPIDIRVSLYQQLGAHLVAQKEQASNLVKQLNGIK